MKRSLFLKIGLLPTVILLFGTGCAFGFCEQPDPPSPKAEFLDSDAVFVGTVIGARSFTYQDGASDGIDGWKYTLSVQERFRGPRTPTISVFTENDSARLPLDIGEQYLLFAVRVSNSFHGFKNPLMIFGCGNSALASDSRQAISLLVSARVPNDALIEARVSHSWSPQGGSEIAGLKLTVRGGGWTYVATSDKTGWFHLRVRPGTYEAEIEPTDRWTFADYDLSIDNPSHFTAEKGRSAELQFLAVDK